MSPLCLGGKVKVLRIKVNMVNARAFDIKSKILSRSEVKCRVKSPTNAKKVYKSLGNTSSSCCRLCKSVGDTSYCKNLFGKGNRALLATAEIIYSSPLIQDKTLPHLLCRPCERRLKNFEILWTRCTLTTGLNRRSALTSI